MIPRRIGDVEAEHTQRVLEAVDADRLVDLTRELIAVPSLSGEETNGQHLVAARMRDVGLDVDTWEIDVGAMESNPWYSAEVERGVAVGVVGSMGGSSGRRLLLNGHIDVVPTGDPAEWTTPPFVPSVRDARVYGRGACDMKGGLAAALHALEAIRAAGVRLAGTVTLASVVGEEDGGCGTLGLLERGVRADGCVIMEPTQCSVVPAVAGALSWRLRVRGRSAHGCLREEGVSAIEAFHPLHRAVLDLERRRNRRVGDPLFAWLDTPFAICGGRIAGGDWPSSEMDWLIWEGRYGVAPGEDLDAARSEFEEAVAAAAAEHAWLRDHPPTVEWWGGQFYPGRTPTDAAVVTDVLAAVTQVTGRQPLVRGMPYGCDLGLTTNVGHIPTVVFGPGDVRDAHRPDEFVPIADLVTVARTIALTALRFCGVATSP
jgi:acetylornithine deacetylase